MLSNTTLPDGVITDWNRLSDELQLVVASSALQRAAETLAQQAEVLAGEMEAGTLSDRGGADALRLFAVIARVAGRQPLPTAGHA